MMRGTEEAEQYERPGFAVRICTEDCFGSVPVAPASPSEMRRLLTKGWSPPGVTLPELDSEAVTSVIRVTGGNFRLFERLLTQIERIAEINKLQKVSKDGVEAARESLVIGQV
jgi:hypothetical protein